MWKEGISEGNGKLKNRNSRAKKKNIQNKSLDGLADWILHVKLLFNGWLNPEHENIV